MRIESALVVRRVTVRVFLINLVGGECADR